MTTNYPNFIRTEILPRIIRYIERNKKEIRDSYSGKYIAISTAGIMDNDKIQSKLLKRVQIENKKTRTILIRKIN